MFSAQKNYLSFLRRRKGTPDLQIAKIIADEQRRLGRPLPLNTLLVLNILKDIPRSDVHQLAEAVQLPETIVRTILEKSVETGLVEAYGSGRGRNYSLAKTVYGNRSRKQAMCFSKTLKKHAMRNSL